MHYSLLIDLHLLYSVFRVVVVNLVGVWLVFYSNFLIKLDLLLLDIELVEEWLYNFRGHLYWSCCVEQ